MTRALITGASGFIGHHLVDRLRESGTEVRCLVRATSKSQRLREMGVELVEGDITDRDSLDRAVEGIDGIFHLAGLTKSLQPRQLWEVNEKGTRNVAEAAAATSTPPLLVYVSSLAAAGPAPAGRARNESDPLHPVSDYGKSKRAGEVVVGSFADRLPITIVRPPIVLGEGDRDGLEMFRGIARWNVHLIPGLRDPLTSVIHATDLAAALEAAAKQGQRLGVDDPVRGTYFAAAEETITYGELGRMIGRSIGRPRVRVLQSPNAGVWGIAAINTWIARLRGRPHILSLDKAREATAGSWACSGETLRRETGFRPGATLQKRLDQTARWYMDAGWLPKRK